MPSKTLKQLAEHVGGELKGNPETKISGVATLEEAGEGQITFLANKKYENQLQKTRASAVIVDKPIPGIQTNLIISDDPYYAFAQIVILLYGHRRHKNTGIDPQANISESAQIGENCNIHKFATVSENAKIGDNCQIYPNAYIGEDTVIGDNCIIYPNVCIYENVQIGNNVTLGANATVGEDGFGYATHAGKHHKIPHIGSVIIEDNVEIGSGCGIERGTISNTVIGEGSKIGDLIAIGHGTKIGKHCLLVAQVGIAGSTTLGDYCVIGGQTGITGHITVGNMVKMGAKSGVINDLPDGSVVIGAPAIDQKEGKRAYALIKYLPKMKQSIKKLEKKIKKLTK
jgi:UDP-3-O-[3-hydroxymyristoyl] glucosamine N-acyltransferase